MPIHSFKKIEEFFERFDPPRDPKFWVKLVEEELKEFNQEESITKKLKEAADLIYVIEGLKYCVDSGEEFLDAHPPGLKEAVFKAISEMYMVYGEILIEVAINRVHESNMTKLGPDGKPIRREDGKILKGPNYKEPDLSDIRKILKEGQEYARRNQQT